MSEGPLDLRDIPITQLWGWVGRLRDRYDIGRVEVLDDGTLALGWLEVPPEQIADWTLDTLYYQLERLCAHYFEPVPDPDPNPGPDPTTP